METDNVARLFTRVAYIDGQLVVKWDDEQSFRSQDVEYDSPHYVCSDRDDFGNTVPVFIQKGTDKLYVPSVEAEAHLM